MFTEYGYLLVPVLLVAGVILSKDKSSCHESYGLSPINSALLLTASTSASAEILEASFRIYDKLSSISEIFERIRTVNIDKQNELLAAHLIRTNIEGDAGYQQRTERLFFLAIMIPLSTLLYILVKKYVINDDKHENTNLVSDVLFGVFQAFIHPFITRQLGNILEQSNRANNEIAEQENILDRREAESLDVQPPPLVLPVDILSTTAIPNQQLRSTSSETQDTLNTAGFFSYRQQPHLPRSQENLNQDQQNEKNEENSVWSFSSFSSEV